MGAGVHERVFQRCVSACDFRHLLFIVDSEGDLFIYYGPRRKKRWHRKSQENSSKSINLAKMNHLSGRDQA